MKRYLGNLQWVLVGLALATLVSNISWARPDWGDPAKRVQRLPETDYGHAAQGGIWQTIAIVISDDKSVSPAAIALQQGETVRLRVANVGASAHVFALGSADVMAQRREAASETSDFKPALGFLRVQPGKSVELVWTFDKAGAFLYGCVEAACGGDESMGKITVTGSITSQ